MEVLQDSHKDTKIGRIPKDWEVKSLKEFALYESSNLSLNSLEDNIGTYNLYGASGLLKKIDFYQKEEESIGLVKDGSGYGNLIWCDTYSSILGTLGRIMNNECSDLKFCFYLLHTLNFKRYMSGSTIPHLYFKDYGNVKLPLPPLPEQQKIAEILSTVDEQISATERIIEKSKELKKGLMQKLFSEGIGHTEFKDTKIGRIPKEWEVKKISALIEEKSIIGHLDGNHGELYPKADEFAEDGVPYIAANTLINGKVDFEKCKRLPMERALKFKKGVARNNDIIFAHNATVGPCAILHSDWDFVILSTSTTYYRLNDSKILPEYWYQYLLSNLFVKQYQRVMGQTTRNQVPIGQQRKFFGAIPSIQEQQKIADILSEADKKIEMEEQYRSELEQLKKGLMQQLLTGQKRVKV